MTCAPWFLLFAAVAHAGERQQPAAAPAARTPEPAADQSAGVQPRNAFAGKRVELNLAGVTDTAAGESRRNENIQFNLVDNNALKELNVRLGTTATIIQEFQADRGYFGAEFGNAPSPLLRVRALAAGGFHGNLYESHQNSVFSARSFFQVGGVRPARSNDYGFGVGVPVGRGGFVSLDGSRQRIRGSVNGNVLVPRPDERTPLTNDPATRAIVTRFLEAYPKELPNRTDINARALNTNSPQSIDNDNGALRLDQPAGPRDRFLLRYSYISQKVLAFELVAGQNPDTSTRAHQARLTWERQWSAETATSVSAGFDRLGSLLVPEKNAVGPLVAVSGLESLGPNGVIPIDRALNTFRYGAQLGQVRGPHSLTFGFDLDRRRLNGLETDSHRGYFAFTNDFGRDAMTNLRLGIPMQHLISIGDVHRGFRSLEAHLYAGDQWSLRPNLALSYGLRYQPVLRPHEVNRLNVIPYHCDCNNLAPRFGLAYRLPGGWGVLRTAYGLHYGEIFPVTYQQVRFSPPGNYKIMVPAPSLVNPLGGLTSEGRLPDARPNLYLLDPQLVTPYAHQYNFSWETRLANNWNLELGYVGSRSEKLLLMLYKNRAHPVDGIPQTTATLNQRRPDQRYAEIRLVTNGSRGYFDAARVSLVVPRWRGVSVDASYWFSKALDLGSSYSNTAYDADSRLARSQWEFESDRDMKGPSPFDQKHAFLWRAAYTTPALPARRRLACRLLANWNLSAVTLLKTGMPFTVLSGSDGPGFGNVDGNGNDRPDLLDASVLGRTIGNPDTSRRLLPRSAFVFMAPTAPRGNLGRNTFRKGGIRNLNAAVSKSWPLRSEKRLTFRAESINLCNTPQFAEPGADLANPNFGQITNTLNDGRAFRFTVQFGF